MKVRLTLGVGCGLATAVAGGYISLNPGRKVEPNLGSDISPGGDYPLESRPPVRMVPIRIPEGNDAYGDTTKKYGDHFQKKMEEFISGHGLVIPDINNHGQEIYGAWEAKKDELRRSYKVEFDVDVTNDDHISPDNIETALRMIIFKLCAGKDEVRKGKYCVVEEGKYGDVS